MVEPIIIRRLTGHHRRIGRDYAGKNAGNDRRVKGRVPKRDYQQKNHQNRAQPQTYAVVLCIVNRSTPTEKKPSCQKESDPDPPGHPQVATERNARQRNPRERQDRQKRRIKAKINNRDRSWPQMFPDREAGHVPNEKIERDRADRPERNHS